MNIDIGQTLKSAQEAYLAGDYPLAIASYETAREVLSDNPYLNINLGNAYFRSNENGKSMHSYLTASKLIPRNRELSNNLSMLMDANKLSQPPLLSYSYMTWLEAFVLALVLNLLFLFRKRISQRKTICFAIAFLFLISVVNLGYITYEQKIQKHAVVVDSSLDAYSGNSNEYSVIFELMDGQIVQVIGEDGAWSKIKVGDNLGWVSNSGLRFI